MKKIQTLELTEKKVVQFFASLADKTRIKILLSLTEKPKTVNEIYSFVGRDKITLSAISHQLKQLSDIEVIYYKRNGKEKIFQLSNEFCWCILRDAFKHFKQSSVKCKMCSKKQAGQK
ncbi:MAG: metalloregulator ArsR/SmtB family transcription factor [Nanoarchaeota archaeon]